MCMEYERQTKLTFSMHIKSSSDFVKIVRIVQAEQCFHPRNSVIVEDDLVIRAFFCSLSLFLFLFSLDWIFIPALLIIRLFLFVCLSVCRSIYLILRSIIVLCTVSSSVCISEFSGVPLSICFAFLIQFWLSSTAHTHTHTLAQIHPQKCNTKTNSHRS